jgi:hypothetical protein
MSNISHLRYLESLRDIRRRVKHLKKMGVSIVNEDPLLHVLLNFYFYRLSLHNILVVMKECAHDDAGKFKRVAKVMGYPHTSMLFDIFKMEFLSCAKSQLLFDGYPGNQSSKLVVFGGSSSDYKVGLLESFLIDNANILCVDKILGRTSIKQLNREAKNHFNWMVKTFKHVVKQLNAIDDGHRFLFHVTHETYAINRPNSDYRVGKEWNTFKELNRGVLPVSKRDWWTFIQVKFLPRAMKIWENTPAALGGGAAINDDNVGDDDDNLDFDVSLKKIKESHYLDLCKW